MSKHTSLRRQANVSQAKTHHDEAAQAERSEQDAEPCRNGKRGAHASRRGDRACTSDAETKKRCASVCEGFILAWAGNLVFDTRENHLLKQRRRGVFDTIGYALN